MNRKRLYKKFIVTFMGLIIIPFIVILSYLLLRSNKLQLETDHAANENLAFQTINSITQQIHLAENLSKSVLQNEMLTSFLGKPFNSSLDLAYYTTTIRDFVKITNGVSDIKLKLYLENETIPIGFSTFYPISYLETMPIITNFYDNEDNLSTWIDGDVTYGDNLGSGSELMDSYCYLHKIPSGTKTIGIMTVTVPKQAFSVPSPNSDDVLHPIELDGFHVYNYTNHPLPTEEITNVLSTQNLFQYSKEFIYTKYLFQDAPFNVVVVTNRSALNTFSLIILVFTVLFSIILVGVFVIYNRRMIVDIHTCLDGLEISIHNSFQTDDGIKHIQNISSNRNDEISLLAQRIEFLLNQTHCLLEKTITQEIAAKQAQLLTLQHQINPHFLYNTMEVFSSKMELNGLYKESEAISAFCRMLRYNINTKELMVTLADELAQVKHFLTIQEIRNIPFTLTTDIPNDLLSQPIIRFLLQPFIENCFKYRRQGTLLQIHIIVKDNTNNIEIMIQNTGQDIPKERLIELNRRFKHGPISLETSGDRIGLSNINHRLKLFYGNEYFIKITTDQIWTNFSFTIKKTLQQSFELS